jgi:hypothetical protein
MSAPRISASRTKKFLAGAFMLAAASAAMPALAQDMPAPATRAQPADQKLNNARGQIGQLVNRAVDAGDFFVRHKSFLEVVEVVKENPQLAAYAMDQVAASFHYLPMDQWNLTITAIQNIAASQSANSGLAGKAYETVAYPLTVAQGALRSGNVAMKTAAADVEVAIAMRMPGYSETIRADLIALLRDTSPRAQEAAGKALEYFIYAGRDNAAAAALYEEPMRNYLTAIQQQYIAATPAQREEGRYTLRRQLELAAYSYGTVVAHHEETAEKGFNLFSEMLKADVPAAGSDDTARAYHAIALNNLRKIGEARALFSGRVLEQIEAHVKTAADPIYFDSLRAVEGIVQRKPARAEQAAAILESMAVEGRYKYELNDIMDAVARIDKKAGSSFLPEVCAKLSPQLAGPKAKELAQALERSATVNEECASALFATLKTLPASGAELAGEGAGIALLGAIADKFPAQKPDAVSLLNAIAQDALQSGKAEILARSGQELRRLNKPQAPKVAP